MAAGSEHGLGDRIVQVAGQHDIYDIENFLIEQRTVVAVDMRL